MTLGKVLTRSGQQHGGKEQQGPGGHGGMAARPLAHPILWRLSPQRSGLMRPCSSCRPPPQVTGFTTNTDTNLWRSGGRGDPSEAPKSL